MKEILNSLAQAMSNQAIAMGAVTEQVRALKLTLAHHFPELADDLKAEAEAEQEKNRVEVYDLQVNLAKLREAIAQLPEVDAGKKRASGSGSGSGGRKASKAPEADGAATAHLSR